MPKKKDKESPIEEKAKKVVVVEEVEESADAEAVADKEDPKAEEITKEEEVVISEAKPVEVEEAEKPKVGKLLWIIVPTTLLVGALTGGIITYFSGLSNVENDTPSPSPVAIVENTEEETEDQTETNSALKREDLKIQVLNGSGVAGAAGKGRDFLQDLGYENVAIGNADSSNLEETEIAILEEKSNFIDLLVGDLEDDYNLASETTTLPASSSYDVVITLGSK